MVTVILGLSGLSCKERINRLRAPGYGTGSTNGVAAALRELICLSSGLCTAEEAAVLNCAMLFWTPREASQLLGVWKETEPEGLS